MQRHAFVINDAETVISIESKSGKIGYQNITREKKRTNTNATGHSTTSLYNLQTQTAASNRTLRYLETRHDYVLDTMQTVVSPNARVSYCAFRL